MVTLTSLRAHGSGDEVALGFEIRQGDDLQKETVILSAKDFADLHLSRGEVSEACFDAVLGVAARYAARKRAMYILTYGRCSEKRLSQKLRAKGVDCTVADETAACLAEEGYLDGKADALREAEKDLQKLWGERRIIADLSAKGYDSRDVREAIASLKKGGADFAEICAERIRKKFGSLSDDPRERQKQIASLERAGFSFSQIRGAMQNSDE